MKRAFATAFRAFLFLPKLLLICILLLCGRWSLALWLWGRGYICTKVAWLFDSDSGMYSRRRWKETRKPVYYRHKDRSGSFWCAVTGYRSRDLGEFHVDHLLSRAGFPMLAYKQWNLRLVRDTVNMKKSDNLDVWAFIVFAVRGRL